MEKKFKEIGSAKFRVSTYLIVEGGEEAVSNSNVAIIELIKNAYDADSASLKLNIDLNNITVSDVGSGMNYKEIEKKFMKIADPYKKEISKTKKGRVPVGSKGIGRLSCQRLGRIMEIETGKKGEDVGHKIIFNWEDYKKDPSKECREIRNKRYRYKKIKKEQGTKVTIKDLNDSWNYETLKELSKDLKIMNPPTGDIKDFEITTNFEDIYKKIKCPDPNFLKLAIFSVKAKFRRGKIINYEFKIINKKNKITGTLEIYEVLSCGDC